MNKEVSVADDTYHSRFAADRKHNKGDKQFKPLKKKCVKCGTTSGQLDIDHKDGNRKNNNRSNLRYICRSCHRKMHAERNGGRGEIERIISTAARIISDPQTQESQAVASAHKNSDLMHVEYILCHATRNENNDRFTPEDMSESTHTAIFKPINWEHKNQNIGTIYEAKYVPINNLAEADKEYFANFDPLEHDFIVVKAAIWEYKHPMEARIMRDRAAENKLFFSMENAFGKAKCSKCEEVFDNVFQYCDHLLQRQKTGEADRIFIDSNFVGSAVTKNPADIHAGTLALAMQNNEKFGFSEIFQAKVMQSLHIEKDIIPYIVDIGVASMVEIRVLNIPDEFRKDYGDLSADSFADNTNKVFPIDCVENVTLSAKQVLNNSLDFYLPQEKLFIVEQVLAAASEYDIEVNSLIDKGEIIMTMDTNSPEFKTALAEALDAKLKEIESGDELKILNEKVAQAESTISDLKTKLTEIDTVKTEIEKEFATYKADTEEVKIAEARWNTLTSKGFAFAKSADFVKASLAKMTDESFNAYVATLEEARELSLQAKADADKAEADKKIPDVVTDSNKVAIASKIEDDKKDGDTAVDLILKDALSL